jgi:hypothetical protein
MKSVKEYLEQILPAASTSSQHNHALMTATRPKSNMLAAGCRQKACSNMAHYRK